MLTSPFLRINLATYKQTGATTAFYIGSSGGTFPTCLFVNM